MIKIPAAIIPVIDMIKKLWENYKTKKKEEKEAIIEDRIQGHKEQVDEYNAFQRWMIRFGKKRD